MTLKEKAKDIFDKYLNLDDEYQGIEYAKKCALITVDEVIDNLVDLSNGEFIFIYQVDYWKEVKQEIENL
jgi:hypothetical protein